LETSSKKLSNERRRTLEADVAASELTQKLRSQSVDESDFRQIQDHRLVSAQAGLGDFANLLDPRSGQIALKLPLGWAGIAADAADLEHWFSVLLDPEEGQATCPQARTGEARRK
jgi:hypothetical protein